MIAFWIASGLLAAAMFAAGVVKLLKSRDELEAMGMLWVADYTTQQVRLIGAAHPNDSLPIRQNPPGIGHFCIHTC